MYAIWYLAIDEGRILASKKPELVAICVCVSTFVKATKFLVYVCVCLNYKSVFSTEIRYRAIIRTFLESNTGSFLSLHD